MTGPLLEVLRNGEAAAMLRLQRRADVEGGVRERARDLVLAQVGGDRLEVRAERGVELSLGYRSDPLTGLYTHRAFQERLRELGLLRLDRGIRRQAVEGTFYYVLSNGGALIDSLDDAMAGVSAVVLVSPAVPAQELTVVASAARISARLRQDGLAVSG